MDATECDIWCVNARDFAVVLYADESRARVADQCSQYVFQRWGRAVSPGWFLGTESIGAGAGGVITGERRVEGDDDERSDDSER